jgi:hypothetical protein
MSDGYECLKTKTKHKRNSNYLIINYFSLLSISGDIYNIVPSAVIVPALSDCEKLRDSPKSPIDYNGKKHHN